MSTTRNLMITCFTAIPDEKESFARLVGEPPVLVLQNVIGSFVLGITGPDGIFQPYSNELSTGAWLVNGTYEGPGSILEISNEH